LKLDYHILSEHQERGDIPAKWRPQFHKLKLSQLLMFVTFKI